jgi:hypothetical protein
VRPAGLAAALALLVLAAPVGADDLDRRVPATPGGVLEVDLDLGEGLRPDPGLLEIRSHDADEVRIAAEASGWGAYGVRFDVEGQGDRVRLWSRVGGTAPWLFGGPRIEVRIWVPRRFSVDARTSAGPIRIENVEGRVRVRSQGTIEVNAVRGTVKLRTRSGALRVADVEGAVDARTGSGEIDVGSVDGEVAASTGDGEVSMRRVTGHIQARSDAGPIDLVDVTGPVDAKTENGTVYASFVGDPAGALETQRGGVEVALPLNAAARVEARAARGSVDLAQGFAVEGPLHDASASVRLNGGGAPLHLYTARGGVRVRPR